MDCQDWDSVKIGVKARGSAAAAAAGGAGRGICPVAPRRSAAAVMAAKLDAADTPMRSKMLSSAAVRTIQDYRREHTMTQEQLNTACGFPANTIKKLELRTLSPDMRQLQTLNRILKTGLTLE